MKTLKAQQVVYIGGLSFSLASIDASQNADNLPSVAATTVPLSDDSQHLENMLVDGECIDFEGRHFTVSLVDGSLDFMAEHVGTIEAPAVPLAPSIAA
jgi:hypothetical protein